MIKRFKKYKKFKEYISWNFENKFAICSTTFLFVFAITFKTWESFDAFEEMISSVLSTWLGAIIGSLALIFAGIVFWASLFDRKFAITINEYAQDENAIERLYTSYLFLAFNIICNCVITLILLFAINSNIQILPVVVFYLLLYVYCFWAFFIIGYFVGIINNCIELIQIKNNEQKQVGKSLYDKANELRIDLLLELICKNLTEDETEAAIINTLKRRVNLGDFSEEEKLALLDYFLFHYSKESKGEIDRK